MNRWAPLIFSLFLAAAFLAGWTFPGTPDEPLGVSRGGKQASGLTLRPGESTLDAVRFLRTLRSDPPVPRPPPPPPPPPLPPPPDVSETFRAALSGIERNPATGVFRVLVMESAASGPQTVARNVGDGFGDGWRISQISEDSVILSKGRETRTIRLYG